MISFIDVFRQEISIINSRRASQRRSQITIKEEGTNSASEPILSVNDDDDANLVGLALSGGGIRSAAFCLGALQALNEVHVFDRVDYLSTVSGGGYVGCCLSACLESRQGIFPFEGESPAVQHIRDYSNYLFPNGTTDLLHNASIYSRGLMANFILVSPFLLFPAAITILLDPKLNYSLIPRLFGFFGDFVVTSYLLLALLCITLIWGVWRSSKGSIDVREIPNTIASNIGRFILLVLFTAFCELQPYLIYTKLESGKPIDLVGPITWLSVTFGPLAVAAAVFKTPIEIFVKRTMEAPGIKHRVVHYLTRPLIFAVAMIVPLLLWMVYVNLSVWGMCPTYDAYTINVSCDIPAWLSEGNWNLAVAARIALLYLILGTMFVMLSFLLAPNANSLHPLYRDRLGRAFLFKPVAILHKDRELELFQLRLSQLSGRYGPYHLINTALNIQNSKAANRRGRDADFFLFSPKYVGSESTGYVTTTRMEELAHGLDLATAMAISGAAASSNMGAESIKVLTPTLALLNIRLGYWLRNPLHLQNSGFSKRRNIWANFYFLVELLGRLNERRKSVYLTDGGHIENLGVYELLKRRCQVVIVIDAEADPEMAFGSFCALMRFARIDLGVQIDLPWQQISERSLETGRAIDSRGYSEPHKGPHAAIGQIRYSRDRKGVLVYIKSSLTGDESDDVFHYKRRYSAFPQESTLDQMFSEEQFESYRALGYHAAFGLFDRRDNFAGLDSTYPEVWKQLALLDELFPHKIKFEERHADFANPLPVT